MVINRNWNKDVGLLKNHVLWWIVFQNGLYHGDENVDKSQSFFSTKGELENLSMNTKDISAIQE